MYNAIYIIKKIDFITKKYSDIITSRSVIWILTLDICYRIGFVIRLALHLKFILLFFILGLFLKTKLYFNEI